MKVIQIILDVFAIIVFAIIALSGDMISPWYVVAWISIAMLEHFRREE